MLAGKSPSGVPVFYQGVIEAFDAADCPALVTTVQSIPVPEAQVGDTIIVVATPGIANISTAPGTCAVAGTALIPFNNPTADAINPGSQAYRYVGFRAAAGES